LFENTEIIKPCPVKKILASPGYKEERNVRLAVAFVPT
jgi:hypothetical protein